jgi:hypothetical protein
MFLFYLFYTIAVLIVRQLVSCGIVNSFFSLSLRMTTGVSSSLVAGIDLFNNATNQFQLSVFSIPPQAHASGTTLVGALRQWYLVFGTVFYTSVRPC